MNKAGHDSEKKKNDNNNNSSCIDTLRDGYYDLRFPFFLLLEAVSFISRLFVFFFFFWLDDPRPRNIYRVAVFFHWFAWIWCFVYVYV